MLFKSQITVLNLVTCLKLIYSEKVYVNTTSGTVMGQTLQVFGHKINQFLGIPYAQPPIGPLRFAKPEPIVEPIKDIIDATYQKNACIQPDVEQFSKFIGHIKKTEDCLFLSIWSKKSKPNRLANNNLKPVMFSIHGGALTFATHFMALYNGSALASLDVVFVAINYRLGPLGFLYGAEETAPGNVGLFDMLMGLQWVRDNIHMFGGDKDQVTIMGSSAGSWGVSTLVISPLTRGYFKRAIMESGAHLFNKDLDLKTKEESLAQAQLMAQQLNCTLDIEWINCLRTIDAQVFNKFAVFHTCPILDTEFLPLSAQKAFETKSFNSDIDLLIGTVKNEGSIFYVHLKDHNLTKAEFVDLVNKTDVMYHNIDVNRITEFYLAHMDKTRKYPIKWAFYDYFGDIFMKCPTYHFAKQFTKNAPESNVFFYEFTYQSKMSALIGGCEEETMGICHAADCEFIYGIPLLTPQYYTAVDIEFTKYLHKMWINFIKHGNPKNDWPKFIDNNNRNARPRVKHLNPIDKKVDIFEDPYRTTCDVFWKDYFVQSDEEQQETTVMPVKKVAKVKRPKSDFTHDLIDEEEIKEFSESSDFEEQDKSSNVF